jgi:hypothetical protein
LCGWSRNNQESLIKKIYGRGRARTNCAGYQRSLSLSPRITGLFVLICVSAVSPGFAAAPKLGVYCIAQKQKPGLQVFADKLLPNGDLAFGLEVFESNGHSISLFGVATRRKDGWEFLRDMTSEDPTERCKVRITSRPDGTPFLVADPVARCESAGGAGTSIGSRHFALSLYEGPVRNELSEPDEFFNNAGKCGN